MVDHSGCCPGVEEQGVESLEVNKNETTIGVDLHSRRLWGIYFRKEPLIPIHICLLSFTL